MNEELLLLVYFFSLFGTCLYWLLLVKQLFSRLTQAHPEKYHALGKPTLGGGGTDVQQTFSLLRFLLHREYQPLNDPQLSNIAGKLRILLIGLPIYFALFTALLIFNQ
jgi:hypothetical protein